MIGYFKYCKLLTRFKLGIEYKNLVYSRAVFVRNVIIVVESNKVSDNGKGRFKNK